MLKWPEGWVVPPPWFDAHTHKHTYAKELSHTQTLQLKRSQKHILHARRQMKGADTDKQTDTLKPTMTQAQTCTPYTQRMQTQADVHKSKFTQISIFWADRKLTQSLTLNTHMYAHIHTHIYTHPEGRMSEPPVGCVLPWLGSAPRGRPLALGTDTFTSHSNRKTQPLHTLGHYCHCRTWPQMLAKTPDRRRKDERELVLRRDGKRKERRGRGGKKGRAALSALHASSWCFSSTHQTSLSSSAHNTALSYLSFILSLDWVH